VGDGRREGFDHGCGTWRATGGGFEWLAVGEVEASAAGRVGEMADRIYESFLARQFEEGMALAAASDLLELAPGPSHAGLPPDRYVATFRCKGLARAAGGRVVEREEFHVGVWFPPDYLRRADPFEVLTWLGPREVFHPNISDRAPFICVGRLAPNTPLIELLYRCFEIITYRKVTMREDDALNREACAWAREHQRRFPVDRRPLKRRALNLKVEASNARR
jgi:hypothetical protein